MSVMSVIEKQWKLIIGLFIAVMVVGGVISALAVQKTNKEHKAQENYFMAEKKYLEIKNKKANPETAAKEKTPDTPADYMTVKTDFDKIIQDYPKSTAAQMSALYLTDILLNEKNTDQALATLQKVESKDDGLVNTLVQQQIGRLQADKDKCQDAVDTWQKIVKRKEASFLHNEVKIQQALCYQKMNDNKKAEELLTNIANQKTDKANEPSTINKDAEKYLRLIQYKKVSGT